MGWELGIDIYAIVSETICHMQLNHKFTLSLQNWFFNSFVLRSPSLKCIDHPMSVSFSKIFFCLLNKLLSFHSRTKTTAFKFCDQKLSKDFSFPFCTFLNHMFSIGKFYFSKQYHFYLFTFTICCVSGLKKGLLTPR